MYSWIYCFPKKLDESKVRVKEYLTKSLKNTISSQLYDSKPHRKYSIAHFLQGVRFNVTFFRIKINSPIVDQISPNMAHLKANTHKFTYLSEFFKNIFVMLENQACQNLASAIMTSHLKCKQLKFNRFGTSNKKFHWFYNLFVKSEIKSVQILALFQ